MNNIWKVTFENEEIIIVICPTIEEVMSHIAKFKLDNVQSMKIEKVTDKLCNWGTIGFFDKL